MFEVTSYILALLPSCAQTLLLLPSSLKVEDLRSIRPKKGVYKFYILQHFKQASINWVDKRKIMDFTVKYSEKTGL